MAVPAIHPGEHLSEELQTLGISAAELARNLGIRFEMVPIGGMFEAYTQALGPVFAGRAADVTEENLQARIRGSLLMAISNKFGSLLLTTGNKSELGVGYCTLYGDMCGGLAVISDVPKTLVYELSNYVNTRSPLIPRSTIDKPPSAELRPDQKDSDSLPDYDVLDHILEDYVEENRAPEEIAAAHGYGPDLVRKVACLVDKSEYKRQQAAPGLKISEKAFGFGRRYPIAAKVEVCEKGSS